MPQLREYITVGICSDYGTGDYQVALSVGDLSREQFDEIRKALCGAIAAAERIYGDAQRAKGPQEMQAAKRTPLFNPITGDPLPLQPTTWSSTLPVSNGGAANPQIAPHSLKKFYPQDTDQKGIGGEV